MNRFSFLRMVLRLNFPDVMLKAWKRHTPCQEYECDVCNPLISNSPLSW